MKDLKNNNNESKANTIMAAVSKAQQGNKMWRSKKARTAKEEIHSNNNSNKDYDANIYLSFMLMKFRSADCGDSLGQSEKKKLFSEKGNRD